MLDESESAASTSIFKMCMARRRAVRRPTPGRRCSSLHTLFSNFDIGYISSICEVRIHPFSPSAKSISLHPSWLRSVVSVTPCEG